VPPILLPPPAPADTAAPIVTIVRAVPTISCPWTVDPTVSAQVTDASAVPSVVLSWRRSPRIGGGSAAMTEASPGAWRGSLGLRRSNGTWTYVVTAVDQFGNTGTATGTIVVSGC
jgi:hypothetical protein